MGDELIRGWRGQLFLPSVHQLIKYVHLYLGRLREMLVRRFNKFFGPPKCARRRPKLVQHSFAMALGARTYLMAPGRKGVENRFDGVACLMREDLRHL